MPYFVFAINQDRSADFLSEFASFAEAKQMVREKRQQLSDDASQTVRMVHAKNQKEARNLLLTPRKPSTPIEEWEG